MAIADRGDNSRGRQWHQRQHSQLRSRHDTDRSSAESHGDAVAVVESNTTVSQSLGDVVTAASDETRRSSSEATTASRSWQQ